MSLLWINGQLVDKADARVSPFDHGFLYGDGVWEPLRAFGGKLFRPREHLSRLFSAAGIAEIAIPLSQAELLTAIEGTLQANNRTDGYIRVIVSRGPGTIGPDPRKIDPQVIIIAEEYQPFPLELYPHGLHAVTAPYPVIINPVTWLRWLGRPDIVLARQHALKAGCLEALLTDTSGAVLGATEGEIFFVLEGNVCATGPGRTVAAHTVLDVARIAAPVHPPIPIQPADLVSAEEVFLAGTSCGVIGIVRLDGHAIGSGTEGPITRAIRERYHTLTRGG